eukprot:TRINITY_DN11503_c0_g1_i1.p1 TRINITY_DN11503_c0_g1~~TRINITY_DN11503_c0_g1_i1.p1  ORF type:complete len:203 (-),score=16.56 TRINITY_DN11503_c0_g1_i1:10-618(-)
MLDSISTSHMALISTSSRNLIRRQKNDKQSKRYYQMDPVGALFYYYSYVLPSMRKKPARRFNPPANQNVTGFVHTADNKPLDNVSLIENGLKICASNIQGTFTQKLSIGRHNIEFHCPGYAPSQREIMIEKDGSASVDITLLPMTTESINLSEGLAKFPNSGAKVQIFPNTLQTADGKDYNCLLYTSPSPRDATLSRMPSSA